MDPKLVEQLVKILALADSSHEGEATVAVKKAKELLGRSGLSFADLAQTAFPVKPRVTLPFLSNQQVHNQLLQLRQRLENLQADVEMYTAQADVWRRRATELEHNLAVRKAEAERWRRLAQDTVDKLWDIGKPKIEQERPVTRRVN
jgi:hypothetical protein